MTLESIRHETAANPAAAVIWLHGLGASGHDFEPLVPELAPALPPTRFIFPHAPERPITVNGGMVMPGWYDIAGFDISQRQDAQGLDASAVAVRELIDEQLALGIPSERLVLAGFSQGGALALHIALRMEARLAGVMALSCYLPLAEQLAKAPPRQQNTPIFWGHGSVDPVVPIELGEASRRWLEARGQPLEWHSYPMPHAVCPDEVADIKRWLAGVLGHGG